MKTLVFEGAGWADADSSKATDIGNCRIRTRLRNNKGRVIYLEIISGHYDSNSKHIPEYAKGLNYVAFIDAVFYTDAKWDNNRNVSRELQPLTDKHFEYNKQNLLKFVNENLDCSFDSVEVYNNNEVYLHGHTEPLCDSSNGEYEPYKDIEVNISELDSINPVYQKDGWFADYGINYNSIVQLPYMKKYIEARSKQEQQAIKNEGGKARFRWDRDGIITSLEIDAGVNVSLGAEDVRMVIDLIKKDNIA